MLTITNMAPVQVFEVMSDDSVVEPVLILVVCRNGLFNCVIVF